MTDQTTAPAAPSAPAAGETSTSTSTATTAAATPAADPTKVTQPGPQDTTTSTTAKPADAAGADDDGEDDGDPSKPRRPSRSQRYKRTIELMGAELDELRRRVPPERPQQDAGKPTAQEGDEAPPKEGDFNGDYLAFERALNAFNVRKAARDAVRSEAERERGERAAARDAERNREVYLGHMERVEEARERIPDFDTTLKAAGDLRVRPEVERELVESDKSALLLLHLAKNPDKARELNQLSGRELARAIGRLEGQVRMPATKKATEAPPPVAPLNGSSAPAFDPAAADMASYAANYRTRMQAKRA